MIEIILIVVILGFALIYTETVSTKSFLNEENGYLLALKESDYDFYCHAKYGDEINCNKLFMSRIKNAFYGTLIILAACVSNLNYLFVIIILVIGYLLFKMPYTNLKTYYKKYMAQVDLLLPYFLKNLEILAQNYTIPVALARSIESAPDVFKSGLRELVAKIDAGDSSINPYMDFAKQYPVSDSMRMMRLLYRLSLGAQENKYKQLLLFSKSVSTLQNKARQVKYQQRLGVMENKTMTMLIVTGGGTMLVLVFAMVSMMGIGI